MTKEKGRTRKKQKQKRGRGRNGKRRYKRNKLPFGFLGFLKLTCESLMSAVAAARSPSDPPFAAVGCWVLTREERESLSLYCRFVFLMFQDAAALSKCNDGSCAPAEHGWGICPSLATQVHGKHAKRGSVSSNNSLICLHKTAQHRKR